jgi:hypothetical protein
MSKDAHMAHISLSLIENIEEVGQGTQQLSRNDCADKQDSQLHLHSG